MGELTRQERTQLQSAARLWTLLDECEAAATKAGNAPVYDMVPYVREVLDWSDRAIRLRWREVGIELTDIPTLDRAGRRLEPRPTRG